jgi:hypothetical protein
MPNFFISYRRSDWEGQYLAHMIFRELRSRYGERSVFFDVDTRSLGLSFPVKVEQALKVTDVVLVVIGPEWLKVLTERAGDTRDWVRYEVAESLKRVGLPVVPVCKAGVEIPRKHELPEDLKDLADRDGFILDPFQDFDVHFARLVRDLEHVLATAKKDREDAVIARQLAELKAGAAAATVRPAASQAARASQVGRAEEKASPAVPPKSSAPVFIPPRAVPPPSVAPAPITPPIKATTAPPRASAPAPRSVEAAKLPGISIPLSRRPNPAGLLLSLLVSLPGIFALAFGYSYSLLWLPFVHLNFILTIVYGVLTGITIGFALKRCRVWRMGMVGLGGFLAGLVADHLSWVVWLQSYSHWSGGWTSLFSLLFSPLRVWNRLQFLSQSGSWALGGYVAKGWVLWLVWSLEGILITALSFLSAGIYLAGSKACEVCASEMTDQRGVADLRSQGRDPEELKRRLEARDFAFLKALGAARNSPQSLWLSLRRCTGCRERNTLEASIVTKAVDPQGITSYKFTTLVSSLPMTSAECDEIERIGREVAGSAKA